MTDTSTLAPCPFCGSSAHGYAIEPHEHSSLLKKLAPSIPDHPGSYVIEGQCACGSGLIGETQAEVTERWNRRAPAPAAKPESLQPGDVRPIVIGGTLCEDGRWWCEGPECYVDPEDCTVLPLHVPAQGKCE